MSSDFPVVVPQGVDGIVIRFADRLTEAGNRATLAFCKALDEANIAGVDECASALASVFVRFDPSMVPYEAVAERIGAILTTRDYYAAALPHDRRLWRIPAVFGGQYAPGLKTAAERVGITQDEAIRELTRQRLRVLALGFAPGQPYLGELPERWNLPRLPDLIDVPEGALVAAIRQLVLFANASPTGWEHVGQTAFRCFRPEDENPIPLRPGDEVQFHQVSAREFEALRRDGPEGGGAVSEALP